MDVSLKYNDGSVRPAPVRNAKGGQYPLLRRRLDPLGDGLQFATGQDHFFTSERDQVIDPVVAPGVDHLIRRARLMLLASLDPIQKMFAGIAPDLDPVQVVQLARKKCNLDLQFLLGHAFLHS
jgi:hypothetical protein